jgi:hypothetical protein
MKKHVKKIDPQSGKIQQLTLKIKTEKIKI